MRIWATNCLCPLYLAGIKNVAYREDSQWTNAHFYVVIERDEDGFYVGEVPQLNACYAQGKTLDELMQNIREVIELCLEEQEQDYFLCARSCSITSNSLRASSRLSGPR